jgi:hypothetical protein
MPKEDRNKIIFSYSSAPTLAYAFVHLFIEQFKSDSQRRRLALRIPILLLSTNTNLCYWCWCRIIGDVSIAMEGVKGVVHVVAGRGVDGEGGDTLRLRLR